MKYFTPLLALVVAVRSQEQQQRSAAECAQAGILAQLIQANIADQQEEQKALGLVQQALAKNDKVAFGQAKNQLLTVVLNGITIREAGQQIAPKNNPAAAGLDKVKNAQLTELNLALNLIGDAQADSAIVAELTKDFAGGIEQNKANFAAATQGCAAAANGTVPNAKPPKPQAKAKGKDAKGKDAKGKDANANAGAAAAAADNTAAADSKADDKNQVNSAADGSAARQQAKGGDAQAKDSGKAAKVRLARHARRFAAW